MLVCYFHTQLDWRVYNKSLPSLTLSIYAYWYYRISLSGNLAKLNLARIVFYLFYHFHKECNKPRQLIAYNSIIVLLKMSENMKLD